MRIMYNMLMRILGVDPGIGRLGWGVIEVEGQNQKAIAYGCIETSMKITEEKRIQEIFHELQNILIQTKPDVLAVEELFFSRNVTTAFSVGQARGVVLLAAAEAGIPLASYYPTAVKSAVTGYGKADKAQIGQMVKVILKLESLPKLDDTTDALAVALTHAFTAKFKRIKSL